MLIMFSLHWETTVGHFFSIIPPWWKEKEQPYHVAYSLLKHLAAIKTFSTFGKNCGQK